VNPFKARLAVLYTALIGANISVWVWAFALFSGRLRSVPASKDIPSVENGLDIKVANGLVRIVLAQLAIIQSPTVNLALFRQIQGTKDPIPNMSDPAEILVEHVAFGTVMHLMHYGTCKKNITYAEK
jgi:hypothetical protein